MANAKSLIADDDRNMVELLRLYIEKEGYSLLHVVFEENCENGRSAELNQVLPLGTDLFMWFKDARTANNDFLLKYTIGNIRDLVDAGYEDMANAFVSAANMYDKQHNNYYDHKDDIDPLDPDFEA